MALLFLFLSLYIGINIRISIIIGVIEAILILAFVFYRFGKKVGFIAIGAVLLGTSISFIRPSFNKEEYRSIVIESKDNYFIAMSTFEKFYISNEDNTYEVGDILLLKGNKKVLHFTMIESGFDFKEYLENKGIYSELVVDQTSILFSSPIKVHQIKKHFLSHFDDETASLISLILFGNNIETNSINLFRDLHLIRLISNSGIFLHLIFTLLIFCFSYLKKDKITKLIAIILFAIYSIFTFPRFVVIKFVLLKTMMWINEYLLKKKFTYLEIVSLLGISCLIFDYHLAYQDSFNLAFLIPIFTLFFNNSFSVKKRWKKRLLLSFLISIMFIPFSLSYNNEISVLSLPFQLVLMPLTSLFGLCSLFSFLGIPMYNALNGYGAFLNKVLQFISPLFLKIYAPPFTTVETLLFELTFFGLVYLFSIKFKDLYKFAVPISVLSFSLYLIPIKRYIYPTVTFINVGQGDSCLITYKNKSILIDTGGSKYKDYATDCLIPYFKKRQIYSIDLLITTHDDVDHNGAVESLITNFSVKRYIKTHESFPVSISNLTISNLNTFSDDWTDDNDKSLVLYFKLPKYNFLIMGDAPKKIEKKIVSSTKKLDVDILKVGHHGSNTSTSEEFIRFISPKEAIISCGENNYYGHPHKETIDILNKYKIVIRRTDIESSITYISSFT